MKSPRFATAACAAFVSSAPALGGTAVVLALSLVLATAARAQEQKPSGFTEGTSEPAPGWKPNAEAAAMREVADLTYKAWKAFDDGDEVRGRQHAREAIRKLEALERDVRGKRAGRSVSRLAMERGRLHLQFLGDTAAAREAFLDALEDDANNRRATRALDDLLVREGLGNTTPGNGVTPPKG